MRCSMTRRWRVVVGVCLVLAVWGMYATSQETEKSVLVVPIRTVKGRVMEGEMIDEGIGRLGALVRQAAGRSPD